MPSHYAGSDTESIASVLNTGYLLLPFFLAIILIRQLIEGDFDIMIVVGACLVFSLLARDQFRKGRLRQSVVSVVIFFNIALTLACTFGNGINDIGIIGYPIIIGFSGIILDQKKLAFAASLSIIGVVWLVFGQLQGLFNPLPPSQGSPGDFMVTALLVILGGVVAFSLTSNMKQSLKNVEREISKSKKDAENLKKRTDEKLEIIEEIHRTVINSLHQIQELIDHKQGDINELNPVYDSLKRKVMVIEAAHEILLSAQAPINLDIRELTIRLLERIEESLTTSTFHIDAGNTTHIVPLDLAINYGICLIELIHEVDNTDNEMLSVKLSISENVISLRLSGFSLDQFEKQGIVIDLLTKQLKGSLIRSSTEFSLSFKYLTES